MQPLQAAGEPSLRAGDWPRVRDQAEAERTQDTSTQKCRALYFAKGPTAPDSDAKRFLHQPSRGWCQKTLRLGEGSALPAVVRLVFLAPQTVNNPQSVASSWKKKGLLHNWPPMQRLGCRGTRGQVGSERTLKAQSLPKKKALKTRLCPTCREGRSPAPGVHTQAGPSPAQGCRWPGSSGGSPALHTPPPVGPGPRTRCTRRTPGTPGSSAICRSRDKGIRGERKAY